MNVELANAIKQLALNAVLANKPTSVKIGEVTSESPLEITIDQKIRLSKSFLVLSRNVTDYEVEMTVNHQVEKMSGGGGDPSFTSHIHQYKGRKPFTVHNALKVGEKVIMIGVQGGQTYVVLDRVEV